tara:strand:+ start:52 stop:258 length:207 start_codon:yes stop_codon:yes gene_type:complete
MSQVDILKKAINREIINNMSLQDLRKVNVIVNKALMNIDEKERKSVNKEKVDFPNSYEKMTSFLQALQ